jgi:ubiquinone biosynthesis monooxygenase Coq7
VANDRASRTIERIIRVNHAGEHGAIRIYRAQIGLGRWLFPDLTPELAEILQHEIAHETAFAEQMRRTGAKPCRLVFLWGVGGAALGFTTACFGRWGVSVCTAAVERAVHRHLKEQIAYLEGRDGVLKAVIEGIQAEEDEHLAFAMARHDPGSAAAKALSLVVACATEVLIFATTRGEARRMTRDLAVT